jgi:hypothetical protein
MMKIASGVRALTRERLKALQEAETLMFHADLCPHLELKEMLSDTSPLARRRFKILFAQYYGFAAAFIKDPFRTRFFEILFDPIRDSEGRPDFARTVLELSKCKNARGRPMMAFSFASKLVAMHCEDSPIDDRHVRAFFDWKPPNASMDQHSRLDAHRGFLEHVADSYLEWAKTADIQEVLQNLKRRDTRLTGCHDIRLLDFLVWKVGNQRLLEAL